jgi:DNA-binding XRE family transcriptional regulator
VNHEELKAKALSKPSVRTEYNALEPEFAMLKEMLLAREQLGLSQEEIAQKMGIKTSAVTRLESSLITGKQLPSLEKIKQYADALNCHIEIKLVHNN